MRCLVAELIRIHVGKGVDLWGVQVIDCMIMGGGCDMCVSKDGGGIGWALGVEGREKKSKIGTKIPK